jgi:5-epi-alpha-selinene synthase
MAGKPVRDTVVPLVPPAVYCPFLPRISPYCAELQRFVVEWAARYRFLVDSASRARFAAARYASLIARAYPDAGYPDLCLAAAWLAFTFELDDHLERTGGAEQRELASKIIRYLRTGAVTAWPLAGALADVWRRTVARTGADWQQRFVDHVCEYLEANAWEADNRVAGRAPGVEEYLTMRRYSAATAMFFDFIEVFGGGVPTAGGLRRHADNAVAWFNDLVSWPKELARGDAHNLVLVLHREHRVPLAGAVELAVAWHDREVRAFVSLAEQAKGVIADGLAHWIRANVDWSAESGRYD